MFDHFSLAVFIFTKQTAFSRVITDKVRPRCHVMLSEEEQSRRQLILRLSLLPAWAGDQANAEEEKDEDYDPFLWTAQDRNLDRIIRHARESNQIFGRLLLEGWPICTTARGYQNRDSRRSEQSRRGSVKCGVAQETVHEMKCKQLTEWHSFLLHFVVRFFVMKSSLL
nr:photosystem II D1 precursor processing protein PSB27-H2, chloroplastic [Ipomoea batatas]